MKIKGFLAILILTVVVVYFIFLAKVGKKSGIETQVDAYEKVKTQVTQTNLASLERGIDLFIGTQGRVPEDLKELRSARIFTVDTLDGWGKGIRYEKLSDTRYKLTSAGGDGIFDTSDDLSLTR